MADDKNSPAFSLNVTDVIEITKNTALVALAPLEALTNCLCSLVQLI